MQLISGQEFGSLFAVLEPKARKGDVKAAALDEVRQLATSRKCDVSCVFLNLSLKNIWNPAGLPGSNAAVVCGVSLP